MIKQAPWTFFFALVVVSALLWYFILLPANEFYYNGIVKNQQQALETQEKQISTLQQTQCAPKVDRHITKDQEDDIVSRLSPYAHKVAVGVYWKYQDGEATDYGERWIGVLKHSHWDVSPQPPGSTAHGVVIETKYALKDQRTTENIRISYRALVDAFKSVDVTTKWEPNNYLKDNAMFIGIGENK